MSRIIFLIRKGTFMARLERIIAYCSLHQKETFTELLRTDTSHHRQVTDAYATREFIPNTLRDKIISLICQHNILDTEFSIYYYVDMIKHIKSLTDYCQYSE